MAVRGSTVMQFLPSEVYSSLTPPENPAIGKLWRNESVIPNELVAWNGKGTSNARSYSVSKNGASISFDDLSNDDRSLEVLVKTIAPQAGSGVSSPTNVRAISGKSNATIRQPKNANQLKNLATNGTSSGLTRVVNANGTITITGTASVDYAKVYILPEVTGGYFTIDNANFRTINTAQKNKPIVFKCLDSTGVIKYLTGGGSGNYPMRVIGAYYDYMIAEGAVNDTAYPYMELSTRTLTAANYMKYDAVETALTPDAALYGITGYEDEIGNDGHVVHKTSIITFNGTEGWSFDTVNQPLLTTLARFDRVVTGVASNPIGLSSRFPFGAPLYNATTSEMVSGHNSGSRITIYLLKSRLTGWSDALTAPEKANLFKTWLSTNSTQVLYQLTTPTIATVAKVDVSGFAGSNIVTSDGQSVTTDYTGSGWDTIGSVQRLDIESVSISNEQGLRVDTILANGDGSVEVPTFFNARGRRYGLFRTTTGEMLLGGMILPNGEPAGVAGAMVSPGTNGDVRFIIDTQILEGGTSIGGDAALRLVMPSFAGSPSQFELIKSGEKVPWALETDWGMLLDGEGVLQDNYSNHLKALDHMRFVIVNSAGAEQCWLLLQKSSEGSAIYTDGAYAAGDAVRTIANFCPIMSMYNVASESIVYNSTSRLFMPKFQTVKDDYSRYEVLIAGTDSRKVGVRIDDSGLYRFVFHVEMNQASTSTAILLYVHRMPSTFVLPTSRNYLLDSDLTARLDYRREGCPPMSSATTTGSLVADMVCTGGDIIVPTVEAYALSKNITGASFTVQKIG